MGESEELARSPRQEDPELHDPQFIREARSASQAASPGPLTPEEEATLFSPEPESPVPEPELAGPPTDPAITFTETSTTTPGLDLGDDLEALRRHGPIEEGGAVRRVSDESPNEPDPFLDWSIDSPTAQAPEAPGEDPVETGRDEPFVSEPRPEFGAGLQRASSSVITAVPTVALRVIAISVGLLLAGGSLRVLSVVGAGGSSGPTAVRGAGWVASGFETFHTRDASGRRVLVLRGTLRAERRAPTPIVAGTLLSGVGRRLGEEVAAFPGRMRDGALSPVRLRSLLEPGPGARAAVEPSSEPSEGFTLLFSEPPPEARRIRIELRSPQGSRS